MIRRRTASVLFTAVAVLALGTAYGCGVDENGAGESSSGDLTPGEDASVATDASATPSDGASPTDGATPKDATSEASDAAITDAAGDGDAALVDSGDSGDVEPPPPPPPPPGPLSPDYVDYDINHVLSTGQSNGTANSANPVLSTMQPYTNIMFNAGPMVGAAPVSFVPLVEGDSNVETMSSGLANEVSSLALGTFEFNVRAGYPTKHDVLVSNHAISGWTYWCLRKDGCSYKGAQKGLPWNNAKGQVTVAKQLATAAGKTYVVRAVTSIHGESDHTGYVQNNPEFPLDGTDGSFRTIKDYSDALLEWQADYETMVKGISGQAESVPLFISQISGWNNSRYSKIATMQLDAHKRSGGKVNLVAPGYIFSFRSDCLHYTANSQRRLGEYFAKAYARVIFQRQAWEPVHPQTITRAANVVTVKYHVPSPPLVIDTVRVTNPGNYGFEFVDDNGTTAITSVVVSAPDTVTITLAATPTGANKRLRYAQNQTASTCVGPGTDGQMGGARGNIRDSDATPSRHGYDLSNWGVNFDEVAE